MNKKIFLIFVLGFVAQNSFAQKLFGDACLGEWNGTMYIYSSGVIRDSVIVKLTVAKTANLNEWTWKTDYLSAKMPLTKDYKLRLKDASKKTYVLDEGDGIELTDYLFENKLYGVFETHETLLTSTYELLGDKLIFEVTSGKKETDSMGEVINYAVSNLQRVEFRRK